MKNVINRNTAILLALVLGLTVLSSCEQEEIIASDTPVNITDATGQGESHRIISPSPKQWSYYEIESTHILKGHEGIYCSAGRILWDFRPPFIQGPNHLSFEGQFNSFIRPIDDFENWYLGTINFLQVELTWQEMDITTKASEVGQLPNYTCRTSSGHFSAPPENVLGYNDPLFGLGYYNYNPKDPTHTPHPVNAIALWNDSPDPKSSSVTRAFIIDVYNFENVESGDYRYSNIYFRIRQAL